MPGRRSNGPIDNSLCRRCQVNEPVVTVRNEPLCRGCFEKYVSTKIVKRMESFRVRNSDPGKERTLLLPLSFGQGSTILLHVLSRHLQGQADRTGRTGFKLHVLHISEREPERGLDEVARLYEVKRRYPDHIYTTSGLYTSLILQEVSSLDANKSSTENGVADEAKLQNFLNSLNSTTSKTDASRILRRRHIVDFALQNQCEAILWGDSTTRLAERTLAETAKGRGFSLPWIVADGESPHGIPFYYPLRDLLSKEIESFAALTNPTLDDLIVKDDVKPATSTKNTSIDDLMSQYFESVERDYPSIVANVVKTAGKLQAVPLSEVERQCELCEMPLDGQAPERSRLCYGCIRTLPQAAE